MKKGYYFIATFIFLMFIAIMHNVEKGVAEDELKYVKKYLPVHLQTKSFKEIRELREELSFNEQLELISSIQDNVLKINPSGKGIPINEERDVRALYKHGEGLCYDRSYSLEQIYSTIGFKTRHVSLFKDVEGQPHIKELITRGTPTHAISEVKTKKGWLIVDSNYKWLGLTNDDTPISMKDIARVKKGIDWKYDLAEPISEFYNNSTKFYYGLYSRHGKFYRPYNFIPDYRLQEFLYNF